MSWTIGTPTTITWTVAGGSFVSFLVEYSSDNGDNWSTLATLDGDATSYEYTPVPGDEASAALVRVTGVSPSRSNSDVCNASFAVNPVLTLTYPNGTEMIEAGDEVAILWTKTGTFTSFDIELSVDNGYTWAPITSGLSGLNTSYSWTVPIGNSENCLVRITGHSAADDISDVSDAVFEIFVAA